MLDRSQYTKYLKKIVEHCKKRRSCAYCGELNGTIKKHSKSFRILHEKYSKIIRATTSFNKNKKQIENQGTAEYLELYENIIDHQQLHYPRKINELEKGLNNYAIHEDLMPWDVYSLFENIHPEDYVLIGLRFASHKPQDLILTKV